MAASSQAVDQGARARLGIVGMTCANCSARVERALARLPGVITATVNLATEQATVTFDSTQLGVDDLRKAVEAAGYQAYPLADGAPEASDAEKAAREQEIRRQQRAFGLAALFSAPLLLGMILHMAGVGGGLSQLLNNGWVQFLLATPVQFGAGRASCRGRVWTRGRR